MYNEAASGILGTGAGACLPFADSPGVFWEPESAALADLVASGAMKSIGVAIHRFMRAPVSRMIVVPGKDVAERNAR